MAAQPKPSVVLLHSKLNWPGVTRDLVIRPRLLNLLNDGLEGAITLVVAPAGFGKTTLVSSWLQMQSDQDGKPLPAAWLSLDQGDADPDLFLRYFISALRTIFPDACSGTLNLLNARQHPPASLLADMLRNELELLPSRFILVLDELQALQGKDVFNQLNSWLQHWPRSMHLVILSRFNPPLPLTSLRAKGLLKDIRSHDLRFSQSEADEYFRRVLGDAPDREALSIINQHLDGWVAGLKMASLSLTGRSNTPAMTTASLNGDTQITDYLIDEILNLQPPAIRRFLSKTSIVDQFCSSLVEALIDGDDADCDVRASLDYLESADLFIATLDPNRTWYSYHQLFRDVLRHRFADEMPAEQIRAMHIRAARWFAAHDLLDLAIHHALEGGDLRQAVYFMELGICDILNREDRPTLERWLRLIPEDFIGQSPELLVMKAWGHGFRWELDQLAWAIERAEALLDKNNGSDQPHALRGQIAVLKGQAFYHTNQHDLVVTYCQDALAALSEQWLYARGIAGVYLGMSLYSSGRAVAAEKYLTGQYESSRDKIDGFALRLLLGLAINLVQAGNYENAERTTQTMLRQAIQGRLSVMEGWSHYLLGLLNYEWNQLDVAAQHFAEVTGQFHRTQWAAARNGMIGQALTFQALGRSDDAMASLDHLSQIDLEYRGREGDDTASARARLMLMRGDLEGAERWADSFHSPPADQPPVIWIEQPHLTRAQILIARNKVSDIKTAIQLLDAIGEIAERTFNTRVKIRVLALYAIALLGDSSSARESLIRSVELARRGLFTRTYLDLGPRMQKLLVQIAGHDSTSITVSRIMAAFHGSEAAQMPPHLLLNAIAASQTDPADDDLYEHLTQRELEVLALMAKPISLKIIASRLNISYATARRYTINLYSKFDVHSRWEAVDIAIRKGIIPPH